MNPNYRAPFASSSSNITSPSSVSTLTDPRLSRFDTAPGTAPRLSALPGTPRVSPMDRPHVILGTALGALYCAPVAASTYILDVGTGSGRWAREVAALFPTARIVGTDMVPPLQESGTPDDPANYTFVPNNVLDGLPFHDATFDFVHMRLVLDSIPSTHWTGLTRELARVTRPGGWIELVAAGLPRGRGPAIQQINQWVTYARLYNGMDVRLTAHVGSLLLNTGLRNVGEHTLDVPISAEAGVAGALMADEFAAMIERFRALALTHGLATHPEFDQAVAAVRMEMLSQHYTQPYHIAFAQR